jgi:undecaprenyl-diphosphatase
MTILQALVLGLIQGFTEFIPISSSAHLIIVPWLFKWDEPSLSFDIALHLGTLISLIAVFARDWVRLIRAGISSIIERKIGPDPDRRLAWLVLIACLPGGLAGLLFESKIEELFHQPDTPISSTAMIAMAVIIVLLGMILFIVERAAKHRRSLNHLTLKDSLIVGFSQALAIFPGVSRSGSAITGGLSAGLRREDAARFSFLLAAPLIAGAGLLSIRDVYDRIMAGAMADTEILLFTLGFLAAALSGYLCIKFLLRFLQRNSTDVFVYYRWSLAVIIVVVALVRG